MGLDRLAPDQRAVVQLVLGQGRSYDDLASILGIPEDAVRERAHAGVRALAPEATPPAGAGDVTDFLLGQQTSAQRATTRQLLQSDPAAHGWAEAVAAELGDVAPDGLPSIPALAGPAGAGATAAPGTAAEPAAAATAPTAATETEAARPRPRPRPLREERTESPRREADAPAEGRRDRPAASRLGGALLIGGLAIAVAAILIFVVGGGDDTETAANGAAEATPTPAATPQQLGQIPLESVPGQRGRGAMALFGQPGAGLVFTLAAERVPELGEGEAYAMWLTRDQGNPRLLGFFQEAPQGDNRQLATSGPREEDSQRFARWLTRYDRIVVSKETGDQPSAPGEIVLQGDLPEDQGDPPEDQG